MSMDPSSVCRLHPGVAVTGFCPACLRDRLAGLNPPSAADLRRCKSFSYARSAAALEPQRRSCDLFRHGQPIAVAVPEEDHQHQEPVRLRPHQPKKSSLGGLLGKKLQQWRRKNKKEPEAVSMPPPEMGCPSWDARSGAVPALGRLPDTMTLSLPLPLEEDDDMVAPAVPRSDGQIPVEEDYYYDHSASAVPGGSVQTRDYYLDSSSSSRRRRSVDRSTTSGRNSFSDANNSELSMPMNMNTRMMMAMNANGNARVSPAAERMYHYHHHEAHHHQSVLVHHQYCRDELQQQQGPNNLRADHFSGSFGSAFRDRDRGVPASKPSKKGWSIWGLISKKSSGRKYSDAAHLDGPAEAAAGEHPWPELRARGYNGQMLRCNSSISARSSFSGSGRRSISGVDTRDAAKNNGHHGGLRTTTRRDEVLLERNLSTRPSASYARSGHHHDLDPAMAPPPPMGVQYHHQFSRPPNIPRRSSSKHEFSSLPRRSTLGL